MKTIKKIVLCSFIILISPIKTSTIEVGLPLNQHIFQGEESVLETAKTLKQITDDKAAKIGADVLTSIAHLCFLYCIIKAIYPHTQEAYKGAMYAK